jgi:hypothetical protein
MSTYRGTVVLESADSKPAGSAVLSKDDAGSWSGTVSFPSSARTPELLNLAEGRLSIHGREGAFVRPDQSDWVNSPTGHFRIRILGNGDAPF